MFEKTFVLNFDKLESIYKGEEMLEAASQAGGNGFRMKSSLIWSGGTYYKNTKKKSYTVDKECLGKEFLI